MEDNKKFVKLQKRKLVADNDNKTKDIKNNEKKNNREDKEISNTEHNRKKRKQDDKEKTDIKEKQSDRLKNNMKEMKSDIKEMKSDIKEMKSDIKEKKRDIKEKKRDIKEKRSDIKEKRSDIKEKQSDIKEKKSDIKENQSDKKYSYIKEKKNDRETKTNKQNLHKDQIEHTSNKSDITSTHKKDSGNYKRSDKKYNKEKTEHVRSNPNYEYFLEDASESEKQIVLHGTVNDRINCLALLCTRNPNEKNFKQLLMFCERQRNDVIYATLKLLRDLCKEVSIESPYIRDRIVKSFEMGAKNQYIKNKVIEIIGVLVRAEFQKEPLVDVLVSRLIEKGETLNLVEKELQSVYLANKEAVFNGIEDFYYKNDNFRCQHNVLKFLPKVDVSGDINFFRFYDSALVSLDEYPQEQKDQMVELIVNGLAQSYCDGAQVSSVEFLRTYVKTARSAMSVLSLLIKTKDAFAEAYVLRVARTTLLRGTRHEPDFLNLVYGLENKDMFCKLVDHSFFYSVPSILSLLVMAVEKRVDTKSLFSLHLLMKHYNPLVRETARRVLYKEKVQVFDPFDKVFVEGQSNILANKQ